MVDIFDKETEALLMLRDFGASILGGDHAFGVVMTILIIALIYLLFNYLLKNIFAGGLIHLIRAYFLRQPTQYKWLPAISRGMRSCLVLIEYQALFAWANVIYVLYIFIW